MEWTIAIERHGAEAEPVVILDGFAPDPDGLVEDAGFLSFAPVGPHYPGVRAAVPPALLRAMLAALAPVAGTVFGSGPLDVIDAYYSLVTTPPAALAPIQRLPHFDGVEKGRLALLLYLARDERSGTAFYRHRATGYETIDAARLPAYRAALAADLAREGMPEPGYIAGDTALFERLALHRGLYNRAILYRSHTLHSAFLPADMDYRADPATGRLTINIFLGEGG
jgi:hypothetical protein